ncbi:hypothetical protein [Costertonia aggregata]|uniref:Lipoprotein n=1 Tax=Costertonia aggregata TaxID=343403 RepID=A0A7H9AR16_9FLAO|nr:hypothetical protein [Costertonia aggregata]QLG45908.1 hypothetical protein HYG79_11295 [Costertonia aggregata]
MRKIILGILTIGILLSCNGDDDSEINIDEQNFLIFGHFYGECGGEGCIETFKLTDKSLFEDTVDDYSGQDMKFIELQNDVFEQVKNLTNFFPNELLNQNETVFGCPDCADGGGLFIQYSENGNIKSWRIDQVKSNVPEYLHVFMDKVNEKIALINE